MLKDLGNAKNNEIGEGENALKDMRRSLHGKLYIGGYIKGLTNSPGQTQSTKQSHADGRDHGKTQTCKGPHPSQAGTPVSGDQVPVRVRQSSIPRAGQEHGATTHVVCAVQPLDSPKTFAGCAGMNARTPRESACKRPEKALQYGLNTLEFDENAYGVSLDKFLNLNSSSREGFADLA